MLRNVLEDYIAQATERQLDLPFLLLLPAMGFYDVHFTHGSLEFGKDFIAKKKVDGAPVQFVFQSKAGNISYGEWRSTIQGQMLSALFNPLRHPNLDQSLKRHVVLVTTGELSGHAAMDFQGMKQDLAINNPGKILELWSGSNLTDYLECHGLRGIHRVTRDDLIVQSQFLLRYSQALDGTLKIRDIEEYSRYWATCSDDVTRHLLWGAIEAEMLSQQCLAHQRFYEAAYTQLSLLRVICALSYSDLRDVVSPLYTLCASSVLRICKEWIDAFVDDWDRERGLSWMMTGMFPFLAYPVQCARILEIAALTYFFSEESDRESLFQFILEFVTSEPGCAHPVGDRYAVHLVLATLILSRHDSFDEAKALIHDAFVWVCDRHVDGFGLAGFEADETEETRQLLGYAFEGIPVEHIQESLLATVCSDLAAFLDDSEFYANVVNDGIACEIILPYWQPVDSMGSCFIESPDVIGYPNVGYTEELTRFEDYSWAEHIASEAESFKFVDAFGSGAAVALMVLLRDRFFPKLWRSLTAR